MKNFYPSCSRVTFHYIIFQAKQKASGNFLPSSSSPLKRGSPRSYCVPPKLASSERTKEVAFDRRISLIPLKLEISP
ncbi:MAG: hypothetical protein A3E92_04165 [Candidatus Taylorbacteria bacterium RIFCSPHIGHO2_12_FULL_42_34]|nr:MAG: hypothetical protein A3E92_04165 [Candidatus Taylorbacteria bacterium RIFCSPHIGHO2_12_FULL_42_34]OHA30823.1 MAG: hypothetical protein A3B09_01345 [Candidatus Taylorbacteria bacterium RIFCSPLOWO2_01_FULL_43_83]